MKMTAIASLFVLMMVSCQQKPLQADQNNSEVIKLTSQDQLRGHIGKRVQVTGNVTRWKMGDRIWSETVYVETDYYRFPDDVVDTDVTANGILNWRPAYVVPEGDPAMQEIQTNESPGRTMPERFWLTDIQLVKE